MERITYRITLDTHRNGIQRTLQGFETADIMARRISISLVSGSDTFYLPMTNVVAMMYVTSPSATEPSINECVIEGNTIIYDVSPITEEGITEMQLKVIGTSERGATRVLLAPRFAVEVAKSNSDDESVKQDPTFTALESAIARADAVYNSRVLRVVIENDCTFKVYYADGTIYENDYFREALYNGNALLAQSYAIGKSGVREGEDTDNAQYYSNVSRSASEDAKKVYEDSHELMKETQLQANYTHFHINFDTGNLGYISTYADFNVNKETGDLEISKDPTYTPEDVILSNAEGVVREVISEFADEIASNTQGIADNKALIEENYNAFTHAMDTDIPNTYAQKTMLDDYVLTENFENSITSLEENVSAKLSVGNIAIVTTSISTPNDNSATSKNVTVAYPDGFNKDNSIVLSVMGMNTNDYDYWVTPMPPTSIAFIAGGTGLHAKLKNNNIEVGIVIPSPSTSLKTYSVKVVLLRLDAV